MKIHPNHCQPPKRRITEYAVVLQLKEVKRAVPATVLAALLGTDSRAVATAARRPVNDGRVKRTFRRGAKGEQVRGFYHFVRLTPKMGG